MELRDLKDLFLQIKADESLFIVSCTKKKIWSEQSFTTDYISARNAYTGENFTSFLVWGQKVNLEERGFNWMIMSGKYGFIEPNHPISNYDVFLGDPRYFGISDESLKNQVRQKRWWKGKELTLNDFSTIICINCKEEYTKKIEYAFSTKDLYYFNFD